LLAAKSSKSLRSSRLKKRHSSPNPSGISEYKQIVLSSTSIHKRASFLILQFVDFHYSMMLWFFFANTVLVVQDLYSTFRYLYTYKLEAQRNRIPSYHRLFLFFFNLENKW
jgi:hypothetical protein